MQSQLQQAYTVNPQATLMREAGSLTVDDLHLSLLSSKPNIPISLHLFSIPPSSPLPSSPEDHCILSSLPSPSAYFSQNSNRHFLRTREA